MELHAARVEKNCSGAHFFALLDYLQKAGQETSPAPYMKACPRFYYHGCGLFLLYFLRAIRMTYEQSKQRSEQKASAQEAAMVTMMMAMATMAAKDHVPQGKSSKQTQHFLFLQFDRFACTGHSVRV